MCSVTNFTGCVSGSTVFFSPAQTVLLQNGALSAVSAVPEPSAFIPLATVLLACAFRRKISACR